jgi:hypothetical protein
MNNPVDGLLLTRLLARCSVKSDTAPGSSFAWVCVCLSVCLGRVGVVVRVASVCVCVGSHVASGGRVLFFAGRCFGPLSVRL